jgi:hypothetical protein
VLSGEATTLMIFFFIAGAFILSWTPYAFLVFWRAFGFGRITAVVLVFAIVFTKSSFE